MANSIQQAKIAATPSEKVKTNELAGRVRVALQNTKRVQNNLLFTCLVYQMEQESLVVDLHMMH